MGGGWNSSGYNNDYNYGPNSFSAMMGGLGWGYGVFSWIFMAFFWVLIIAVIILLARRIAGVRHYDGQRNSLDILKERYAKGEITKEEFKSMKKELG